MRRYAVQYNDFIIVDGTHNTVMYDLKLMPYTVVCALGKSVIAGFALDESENGETVTDGLSMFNLGRAGSTLMTDGGSAFPSAASEAQMHHILCSQHFQREVFSSAGGLAENADYFKRDANALIFANFESIERWHEKYQECVSTYSAFPKALSCIRNIYKSKEKVCKCFTSNCVPK
ncbi:MAG: transposase domain [Bacteroidota bacterium]